MPGLMRGMARTAAVVGTATATRNAVNRHAQANAQAQQAANVQQAPPPQVQYAPAELAPVPQDDMIAQIERLGALKAQGLLTDEEFAAAKQRLLAS